MATVRERILDYLSQHPEGADDDELTVALSLRYRQQANSCCHQLAKEGFIERRRANGKLRNFLKSVTKTEERHIEKRRRAPLAVEPWHWEGNVQSSVAEFLRAKGYSILRMADTRNREAGRDIEAQKDNQTLWVTVKGYPKCTPRTRPSTQAGHWFKDALFDIIYWRGENSRLELVMALPDFPRYRKLANRAAWLQPIARFSLMWVQEDGTVVW